MQPLAVRRQVLLAGVGAAQTLQRVVDQQTQELDELGAALAGEPQLVEQVGLVGLEMSDVEADDLREGVALDQLLRGRAQVAVGVQHDLPLVDVQAKDGHATLLSRGWRGG